MAIDFSRRSREDELMDTEPVPFEEFRDCLVDLARVNRLTFAYRPTVAFFDELLPIARGLGRPMRIVDAGSGYGDMLRRIADWARANEVDVELAGVDLNPWSAKAAAESTAGDDIDWVTGDLFDYRPEGGIDVVVSSLFTHHLSDEAVVRFLSWMDETAQVGWFVNDLHRHRVPYHFFRHFAKLAGFHRFVQHDGPVSIARAFTEADWRAFLRRAEVAGAQVRWWMPFRITVGKVSR